MSARFRFLCAAAAALLLGAPAARADFLDVEAGARPLGMGGAFVAVADDANAPYWNPAGLVRVERASVTGMRTRVYGVDDLNEDYLGGAIRFRDGRTGFGAAWARTGISDVYDETMVLVSGAQRVWGERLSLGASYRLLQVAAPGYDYFNDPAFRGDVNEHTADLGAQLYLGNTTIGIAAHSVTEPEVKLIETTSDPDVVSMLVRVGAATLFRETLLVSGELRRRGDTPDYKDDWTPHIGTEVWFQKAFAARAGIDRDRLTAGIGIRMPHMQLDIALLTHRRLGNLYRLSASVWP